MVPALPQSKYITLLYRPTVIAALGYKNAVANLLSTPPFVLVRIF